ncbi:MAG TPA: SHOCT domain-containing protein, partial [Propionibacteriaceae bacterium]
MPPRGPRGPHGWEESSLSVLPFVGSFLLLLLILALALTAFYLWRQGKLPFSLSRPRSPEEDAKRILAERFAQGDISTEEFMERSSILNWTPGAEP